MFIAFTTITKTRIQINKNYQNREAQTIYSLLDFLSSPLLINSNKQRYILLKNTSKLVSNYDIKNIFYSRASTLEIKLY